MKRHYIIEFYQRNFLERLVLYCVLSSFIGAVIFEFALGQWSYRQAQNKQWIYYGFLALDCLISMPKILRLRVTVNPMSVYALLMFIMCAHGLFIGVYLRNAPFEIFNDFVPICMIGLHTLRMQSYAESQNINFTRLLKEVTFISFTTCVILFISKMIGNPSTPTLGNSTIFLPLFFAGLWFIRPFPKWIILCTLIMIFISLDHFNRTTMVFMLIAVALYMLNQMIRFPGRGLLGVVVLMSFATVLLLSLDKEGATYKRIEGISKIDGDKTTGSVGERNAEWLAIKAKLRHQGETIHWLGLGFGGVFDVAFTHEFLKNHTHAHYSWAWFNLRFGKIGYVYLACLLAALFYNMLRVLYQRDVVTLYISLLCLICLLYTFTHVNSVFLLTGLCFYYSRATKK